MTDDSLKQVADTVRQTLEKLRAERDGLTVELENLNQQIVKLERVLNDLSPFVEEIRLEVADQMFVEGVSDLALAEAVRKILASSKGVFRTARGIRASLETSGYDLGQHNNALASIHGVLKRLVESGEAESVETEGKTRYRWKGNVTVTPETARLNLTTHAPEIQIRKRGLRNVKIGGK
jgi:chromosome segregation ATPase